MDESEGESKGKNLDRILSTLQERGELTISDKEFLKLRDDDHNLTIVESAEYFLWDTSKGAYYNIVTGKNFDKDKVAYFDEFSDLLRIDMDKLAVLDNSYMLDGELECVIEGVRGIPKGPDFNKLNLAVHIGKNKGKREKIDLSAYKLSTSARVREFYSVDKGLRVSEEKSPFHNISMIAKLKGDCDIDLVYRKTFKGSEKIGSRLYLRMGKGKNIMLDKENNSSIISFMEYLHDVHIGAFEETSCNVSKFGHKPDYMNMYL
jgi:hypothetical protein